MTAWYERTLFAYDCESTGVDVETARIVTASVIRITPDRVVYPYSWLVDPGVDIPAEATAVHGITTERAREDGMDPRVAVGEIAQAIGGAWFDGHPVVIFNAPYDLTVLDRELRRHGWAPLTPGPVVDPLVIDKQVDRYRRGKRTLEAACAHYVAWRAEQSASLASYFRRLGAEQDDPDEAAALLLKAAGVDGSWPLVPYTREGVPA